MSQNAEWIQRSDDEILLAIGTALATEQRFAFPPSSKRLLEMATEWLHTKWSALLEALCKSDKVQRYAKMREGELLFEAACEVLVHVTAGLPAGCVAAYMVRRGVDGLCSKHWCSRPEEQQ